MRVYSALAAYDWYCCYSGSHHSWLVWVVSRNFGILSFFNFLPLRREGGNSKLISCLFMFNYSNCHLPRHRKSYLQVLQSSRYPAPVEQALESCLIVEINSNRKKISKQNQQCVSYDYMFHGFVHTPQFNLLLKAIWMVSSFST